MSATDQPGTPQVAGRRPRLVALVALVAITALVLAVLVWRRDAPPSDDERAADAAAAGVAAVEELVSFDQGRVTEEVAADSAGLTDTFADRYAASVRDLGNAPARAGVTVTTELVEVGVGRIGGDRVRLLARLAVTSAAPGAAAQSAERTFVVSMLEVDGRWLVDGVEPA